MVIPIQYSNIPVSNCEEKMQAALYKKNIIFCKKVRNLGGFRLFL